MQGEQWLFMYSMCAYAYTCLSAWRKLLVPNLLLHPAKFLSTPLFALNIILLTHHHFPPAILTSALSTSLTWEALSCHRLCYFLSPAWTICNHSCPDVSFISNYMETLGNHREKHLPTFHKKEMERLYIYKTVNGTDSHVISCSLCLPWFELLQIGVHIYLKCTRWKGLFLVLLSQ